ncbi:double zinc ribbon domain-containing protein [Halobaculum limi]|uniref:double zinc ribbon domain-containing protein n=1 Tax=Halobaculum limi TaxID=3031916 RepID=UPI002405F6BD|nr:zinc ribbon domain-containing protein [Halobaculum sp. YSMS11]
MSKITFRADADLVDRLESLEGSKSEVMREALRAYLDDADSSDDVVDETDGTSLDDALATRVDELVDARLDEVLELRHHDRPAVGRTVVPESPSVNLTVNVEGGDTATVDRDDVTETAPSADRRTPSSERAAAPSDTADHSCAQCGESVSDDHVYCPNCGEKASNRLFCECGDELRSDWGFCPGCGRRTPAADVLDKR